MVVLAGKAKTIDEARTLLQEALESGKALAKFKEMIKIKGRPNDRGTTRTNFDCTLHNNGASC